MLPLAHRRADARWRGLLAIMIGLAGSLALAACGGSSASTSRRHTTTTGPPRPATFSVFPVPGSRVASPTAQVAFRGAPSARLGRVVITGSRSGAHSGHLQPDSDGDGASFLPDRPFHPGERVTVRAGAHLVGTSGDVTHFTVAIPASPPPPMKVNPAARVLGDLDQFHSAPDLSAPAVKVLASSPATAPGDIFVANQNGPVHDGPMILDRAGGLVWFHPLPAGQQADDFRVQTYEGAPVLTWWQGVLGPGIGRGEDVIYDRSYRPIAVVHAANGLSADLHEFQLTAAGTALITAYFPVVWDASSVHGSPKTVVLDAVAQEIDVRTGLLLFQWDSLDHVPLADSELPVPSAAGQPFDYFHINSVDPDGDGNLIVSARNTWAAYKIDRRGRVLWILGGKRSTYRLDAGAAFAFQHDVHARNGDRTVTMFDDGAGPPTVHPASRGLVLALDASHQTAAATTVLSHTPAVSAQFEGNVQVLPDGDDFVGWGGQPYMTEYTRDGGLAYDARFVDRNASYRAYRFPWSGAPVTPPQLDVVRTAAMTTVYVSWNGATQVRSWRVLAGSAGALTPVATVAKSGFETQIDVATAPEVAVQALGAGNRVLATSATERVG